MHLDSIQENHVGVWPSMLLTIGECPHSCSNRYGLSHMNSILSFLEDHERIQQDLWQAKC